GYGPDPWLVGQYFPIEAAAGELDRLTEGAIVGAATLLCAALLALLMGLRMARSIRTLTSAAEAIERLEVGHPGRASGGSSTSRPAGGRGCARSTTPRAASTRRAIRCAGSASTCPSAW